MPPRPPIFVLTVVVVMALCFGATPSAAQTNLIGQWARVASLPYFPVHTHLLPTGQVMIWPGDGGVSGNDPRSWDPADPFNVDPLNADNAAHVSILSKPGYDIFCSGHSFLADGRLFVAGGHNGSNNVGLSRASTYNPFATTNAWSNLPDMNDGRWYPTTTVLANGDVLVVSGDIDLTVGVNTEPQVFQIAPAPGMWRDLTNAHLAQDLYPMMLLAPNSRVFNAAPTATTRYLNTSGTGAWTSVATRVGGARFYGSAVMYEPGKVLVMGGGSPSPKNTAEVIDLNAASPSWRAVDSMQFLRKHLNATLLPDGNVLVTGGTAAPGFSDPSGHVDAAELWDPATENWTTLASSSGIPRVYHSTALLLPDGRILSTGGNGFPDTEIYSPPYLFKGTRPTITSVPASVAYGQSFFVGTPNAAAISKITMLRLSSVTHAFNQSQYINQLSFAQTTGGLNVTAPSAPTAIGPPPVVAPPGYYLLFLLNGSGVPSVAQIIRLGGTASPPPPPPPAPPPPPPPPPAPPPPPPVSTITIGETNILSVTDGNNGNRLVAQRATLSQTATIQSLSFYVVTASGNLRLGIYDATGPGGGPGAKKAETASITPTTGWNTANVITPVSLPPGTYWLAYLASSNSLKFRGQNTGGNSKLYPFPFGTTGTMPATFSTAPGSSVWRWSLYATLTLNTTSDTTPPTVSITAPPDNDPPVTVSGTAVAVSATASDNVEVAGVQFKLDGPNDLGAEDTTSPYSVTWNSTTAANGSHTLTAVARDAAGNVTTSTGVSVTVNNASPPPPAPPPPPPPPPAPPPPPPVSTITIGETSILSVTDSNNGNKLVSQPATLSQTATIRSLSFYVVTASGNLRLGIYDATGPGGGPGAKKAETASITPTTGWNTANVITPVSLPPGTYWLAYLASSNSLKFRGQNTGGNSKLYPFPFGTTGTMPATFSTAPGSSVWRWSLNATLTLN